MKTDRYLFRGKDYIGNWVHGSLIIYQSSTQIGVLQFSDSMTFVKVKPETVGQFTGIHDVKNSRIFADDLMKSPEGDIFRIYHVEGGFVIKARYWYADTKDLVAYDDLIFEHLTNPQIRQFIEECEVIGNIHDK